MSFSRLPRPTADSKAWGYACGQLGTQAERAEDGEGRWRGAPPPKEKVTMRPTTYWEPIVVGREAAADCVVCDKKIHEGELVCHERCSDALKIQSERADATRALTLQVNANKGTIAGLEKRVVRVESQVLMNTKLMTVCEEKVSSQYGRSVAIPLPVSPHPLHIVGAQCSSW